jgi:hypothetical protein
MERLYAHFPRQGVLVLLFEEIEADPAAVLRKLFTFLGANPAPLAKVGDVHTNRYRVTNETSGRKEVATYPPMEEATKKQLAAEFSDSTHRLAEWLGRDLSIWSSG